MFHSRQFLTVCAAIVAVVPTMLGAQTPRVIALKASDDMKFSVTQILAKPGESLRVRLTATGAVPKAAMAHNFVLLAGGADPAAFDMAAAMARATDFIPVKLKASVLAATKLAGAGETVEVTFKAPTKAVSTCSCAAFPGTTTTA